MSKLSLSLACMRACCAYTYEGILLARLAYSYEPAHTPMSKLSLSLACSSVLTYADVC